MRERTVGRGLSTRAIHAGERPDPTTHAHRTPIYATATFTFDSAAQKEEAVDRSLAWEPGAYFYSRTGNPTNRALEENWRHSKAPRTPWSPRPGWRPWLPPCSRT